MISRRVQVGMLIALLVGAIALGIGLWAAYRNPAPRLVTVNEKGPTTTRSNRGTPAWPGMTFEDGTFWQLTGLREYPDGDQWWGGNGSREPEPKAPAGRASSATKPGMRLIEFRYRSTGTDDAFLRRFQYTCPKGRVLDHHWQPQSHIVFTGSVIVAVPEELDRADIRIGLGAGKPTDLLHTDVTFAPAATQPTLRSNIPPATSRAIETGTVRFGEILYENGDIEVELFDRRTPEQRDQASGNLCVITRSGKPMHWTGFANHDDKFFYAFALQKQQIAAVVFQSRDYLWMTLPNVPLRPKSPAPTAQ